MDDLIAGGRSLSVYILLPATAVFAVMLVLVLSRTSSRVTQFVVFAIWFRWIMSAFHDYTYKPSPIGLSYNALASVGVIGLGLLVIKSRKILDVGVVPFYFLIGVVVLSGAYNHLIPGMVDMAVKYAYLAVMVLAVVDAINEVGTERFTKLAIWPYAIPFGLQALSVVLHSAKASERDGSISYIGGYEHEAAFSMILASGLVLVCLGRRLGAVMKTVLIGACVAGIILANYRTAILAMAPMVGVTMVTGITRRFIPSQRALVTGAMAICAAAVLGAGFVAMADRFSDLNAALSQGTGLIKPQEDFDTTDRRLLSARPYIWSGYIFGYANSKPVQHLLGLGPNAWSGVFKVYAHNTLISCIYELGALGVAAMLFLWGWMAWLAARVTDGSRSLLLGGHASFFVLNMATMPLWNVEGLILYALLCGFTVAAYQARGRTVYQGVPVDQELPWPAEAGELA